VKLSSFVTDDPVFLAPQDAIKVLHPEDGCCSCSPRRW